MKKQSLNFLESCRSLIKKLPFYQCLKERHKPTFIQLKTIFVRYKQQKAYKNWLIAGKPIPPPSRYKQKVIIEYSRRFHTPIFVETGTFKGYTIAAVHNKFKEAYTIELGTSLYIKANKTFNHKHNVTFLHGNSSDILKQLMPLIDRPCMFWLDAHYSGVGTMRGSADTPIMDELSAIAKHTFKARDVILIDDARCFGAKEYPDYPAIELIRDWSKNEGFNSFFIENDIIRIFNN